MNRHTFKVEGGCLPLLVALLLVATGLGAAIGLAIGIARMVAGCFA